MKANWKETPRGDIIGLWSAFYVTMNRRGYIVMNKMTYQRVGEPKAFLLLFDRANNRIGLKPTAAAMKNAYPAAKHGRHGGKLVRAYRMMQEFGIDISDTLHFQNVEVDTDGILILDLRTAIISARAKGHTKPARKPADARVID